MTFTENTPTLLTQLRHLQAKFAERTIDAQTPTKRVEHPVWDDPTERKEK